MKSKTKLNPTQAADLLGVHRTHIYNLIKYGMPSEKSASGRIRLEVEKIVPWYEDYSGYKIEHYIGPREKQS
jgi:hypothetical protein